MAYSIQYSPNGAKPMISNYVKVSHAWFDYIKNHTDINLHGFTLTSYSNYVSIDYYHSAKSFEKEFKNLDDNEINFKLAEFIKTIECSRV